MHGCVYVGFGRFQPKCEVDVVVLNVSYCAVVMVGMMVVILVVECVVHGLRKWVILDVF